MGTRAGHAWVRAARLCGDNGIHSRGTQKKTLLLLFCYSVCKSGVWRGIKRPRWGHKSSRCLPGKPSALEHSQGLGQPGASEGFLSAHEGQSRCFGQGNREAAGRNATEGKKEGWRSVVGGDEGSR